VAIVMSDNKLIIHVSSFSFISFTSQHKESNKISHISCFLNIKVQKTELKKKQML
jgi:hypothetical protein